MSRLDFTDPAVLAALTDMLTAAGVEGLEVTTPDTTIRLVVSVPQGKNAAVSSAGDSAAVAGKTLAVKAPMAGHFDVAHSSLQASAGAFPRPVGASDVIGFIRVGVILLPVIAGRAGSLVRQIAAQDALVGFGDALFEIEPQS